VTSLFCAITLAPEILGNSSNNIEGDNTVNKALTLVAFIMDATFAVALALFCVAHFYMASKNQTSLEDSKQSKRYDLGWYENMQTVFGVDHWTWFIPHHISPTLGDGVHWKLSDGTWEGFADSATSTV
jgi:hypothetical protein